MSDRTRIRADAVARRSPLSVGRCRFSLSAALGGLGAWTASAIFPLVVGLGLICVESPLYYRRAIAAGRQTKIHKERVKP